MDFLRTTFEEAKEKLRQGQGIGSDLVEAAESRLDELLLQLQIDVDPSHGVRAQSLNDHPLGFGRPEIINSLAQASLRELERGTLIEGTDFEHALVKAYRENGTPAWVDEFDSNRGADVYVTKGEPDPEVVEFLEAEGGKWQDNLCFYENVPKRRVGKGQSVPLPDNLAERAWAFIEPVGLKTKAEKKANPEEFTYDLLHSLAEFGRPRHSRGPSGIDSEWVGKVLDDALDHTDHYGSSLVAHYVPVVDDEEEAVQCTLHDVPHSLLVGRLKEARRLFSGDDRPPAWRQAEDSGLVQVSKTKMGTVQILFFNHEHQSVSGGAAPQFRLLLSPPDDRNSKKPKQGKLQVQLHTDETVACSSFVQEAPAAKRDQYRGYDTIERNKKAELYRDAIARGEKPPGQKPREWYRVRPADS